MIHILPSADRAWSAFRSLVMVIGDRICVQPSFADVMTVKRLGARYNAAERQWEFPATHDTALTLERALLDSDGTPGFGALLERDQPEEVGTPETPPQVAPVTPQLAPVAPGSKPEVVIPPGLKSAPWPHQREAVDFCLERFNRGLHGVLLAMGMGTGKSLVALMLILALSVRRILIACPLRVISVWESQFERHVSAPMLVVPLDEDVGSVTRKMERAREKMTLAEALGIPFVAVINYESAWRDPFAEWAEKTQWDLVIADEIHRIKAAGGKASKFFQRLRIHATYRVGLTGTPMPHGPMDIFAPMRFLEITIFGRSFSGYRTRYAVMGGFQRKQITGFQHLDELEAKMSRVTFRVGAEVLDLPPAVHVTYNCDLTPEAARIYRDLEEDFVAHVLDGTVTAANAMVKLLRLQQVTGGCVPTDDGAVHRVDTSKQKLLADTLEDIGKDEAVVVFCRFHADLDAVHAACAQMGIATLELSGRRDDLKRWQSGDAQVLAVQISAGGIGVDLTRARYSVYYSLSFSLGEYDQALARVHRPGQTRPVEHIHLVARNTVDVKIMRALEKRAEIVQAILAEIKH